MALGLARYGYHRTLLLLLPLAAVAVLHTCLVLQALEVVSKDEWARELWPLGALAVG